MYQARNHLIVTVLLFSSLLPILAIFSQTLVMSRTPTGVETPDVIDLRKAQRKEPEKQLYQVNIMHCLELWLMLCN